MQGRTWFIVKKCFFVYGPVIRMLAVTNHFTWRRIGATLFTTWQVWMNRYTLKLWTRPPHYLQ